MFKIKAMLSHQFAVALIFYGSAQAQTSGDAPAPPMESAQPSSLEEIVVTAQKRSENLQDVPIAVNVVTATQLANVGVVDIFDVRVLVPTLNATNSAGYLTTSLRGVGSNGVGPGVENPIALYVDGVYYAAAASSLLSLNNISAIEVLKGPQGTLFGRNATGGLIQITTRDPGQELSGEFNLSYGNFQTATASAYLGGGIATGMRADIAAAGVNQGQGWGQNLANGRDSYKVGRDYAIRSKWILDPAEGTQITVIGDYSDHADSMTSNTVIPGTQTGYPPLPGSPPILTAPQTGYDIRNDYHPLIANTTRGLSLKWQQDLGDLRFMSLSAYRNSRTEFHIDYDASEQPIEEVFYFQFDRQFSEELQLSSNTEGRFSWLLGAYYFNASSELDPFVLNANDLGIAVTVFNRQTTRSIAGYAQATYQIFAGTNFTLGGRYTSETRKALDGSTDVTVTPLALQLPTVVAPDVKATFTKPTFRASLDHRFSDSLLAYASFNRGFKSGGFNTGVPGSVSYNPETLDAYEIGVKTNLLDRKVRFNAAAFYYDYSDVQIQKLTSGAITVINGASARIYGVDADVTAQVTSDLRMNAGVGVLSPKFSSFPNCPVSTPAGGSPVTTGSCADNFLPLASRATAHLASDYEILMRSGTLNLNANAYYNSGFRLESDNVIRQGSFTELGGSITYTTLGGMSVGTFVKNLTDRRVLNFVTTIPNGTHYGYYAAPRTYGLTAAYSF